MVRSITSIKEETNMKRIIAMLGAACALVTASAIHAEEYKGAPRTFLYNPALEVCFKDTAQYKKTGPFTIGFSNAGLGDSWRVVTLPVRDQCANCDHGWQGDSVNQARPIVQRPSLDQRTCQPTRNWRDG